MKEIPGFVGFCLAWAALAPLLAFGQIIQPEQLAPIAKIVEEEIRAGNIPGAVILIGNQGKVVYREAFGDRLISPKKMMAPDTIFDIASLTKVVATTPAILRLAEQGRLDLASPVARYWPEFKEKGKQSITVQHLLTHYSGLPATLPLQPSWSGYDKAIERIKALKPFCPPGTAFLYGDVNFIILGELVRRVSGKPLDQYCQEEIFEPLGMKDTAFKPSAQKSGRIAPTKGRPGEVHDPIADRMGGVAGHAGLFSTADDLAIFAQTLLDGGQTGGGPLFSRRMIDRMALPQSPINRGALRSLGWELNSPFGTDGSDLLPVGSYGHRGYTGTLIWIDPLSKTYIIILTHRVYRGEKASAEPLRGQILTLVSYAIGPVPTERVLKDRPEMTEYISLPPPTPGPVRTGIDVLAARKFSTLWGMRVGLITNHSGLNSEGRRTIDLLYQAPGVRLKALFSPEHGPLGQAEQKVPSSQDPITGLPIHSLYGTDLKPNKEMLKGLDALVFDIQDAGVRFYTYITTMGYAMEAAAEQNIRFFVLDRPNPITGTQVQGPVMDPDLRSFTGYFPLPIRHGMTVGELARMFNYENRLDLRLGVIRMSGYRRAQWYDETGLRWVNPSPNLRTMDQAVLYPGVALVEGANVSVGRGTPTPFEHFGAPWIQGEELADYLSQRNIRGVRFRPTIFVPENHRFKGEPCSGVRIFLIDRQALDSAALGIEIVSALCRLYPNRFEIDKTIRLVGSRAVLQAIRDGIDPRQIASAWQEPLGQFERMRSRYLLYLK